jgi:hypothetical protein
MQDAPIALHILEEPLDAHLLAAEEAHDAMDNFKRFSTDRQIDFQRTSVCVHEALRALEARIQEWKDAISQFSDAVRSVRIGFGAGIEVQRLCSVAYENSPNEYSFPVDFRNDGTEASRLRRFRQWRFCVH